jgi:hypothetical protein
MIQAVCSTTCIVSKTAISSTCSVPVTAISRCSFRRRSPSQTINKTCCARKQNCREAMPSRQISRGRRARECDRPSTSAVPPRIATTAARRRDSGRKNHRCAISRIESAVSRQPESRADPLNAAHARRQGAAHNSPSHTVFSSSSCRTSILSLARASCSRSCARSASIDSCTPWTGRAGS